MRPRDAKALFKWGTALLEHADGAGAALSVDARVTMLLSARQKLERAYKLHAQDYAFTYNLGKTLLALFRLRNQSRAAPAEAAALLDEGIECFRRATTCARLNLGPRSP